MKKEVLIAIIIGFGLGLVITFGIWSANRNLGSRETSTTAVPEIVSPTLPPQKTDLFLEIISPENNLLTDQETLVLEGKTTPSATVVLLGEDLELISETGDDGRFFFDLELTAGINRFTVIASDNQGNETRKEIHIVFSTAEI